MLVNTKPDVRVFLNNSASPEGGVTPPPPSDPLWSALPLVCICLFFNWVTPPRPPPPRTPPPSLK